MRGRHAIAAALALAAMAPAARGQSWSTATAVRQARATDSLRVVVDYAAGGLTLRRAPADLLYEVRLRYDESAFEPVRDFDAAASALTVGVRPRDGGRSLPLPRRRGEGEMTLALNPDARLDLSLELGAARADIDLSGLDVRSLALRSGASDASIRFGTPNGAAMDELRVDVGAAELRIEGLGNANAARARIRCGVGDVELDLGGAWARDLELQVEIVLGELSLDLPRGVGARLRLDRTMASLDAPGLVRRGDEWVTPGFDEAARRITIDATTVLGAVRVTYPGR